MPERIIITGATGFIGRALVRDLAAGGYEVVPLTRNPALGGRSVGEGFPAVRWDGRTAEGWGALAEGALAVINLAGDNLGRGRWTRRKKARILASRLEAGAAVSEAVRMAEIKPRTVIQASAVGYYGPREDERLDEDSAPGGGFLADVVRCWEDSTRAVEDLGVRRVVIRSGLVLGRGGGAFPRLVLPFRLWAGGPLGGGRQGFSWISLDDEVRAIRFLLEREGLKGVFNLTAPRLLLQKEFCRALGRAMRRPCWMPVPGWLMRLLFGEKARETLLTGQRAYPKRLVDAGFEFLHPGADEALKHLLGGNRAR